MASKLTIRQSSDNIPTSKVGTANRPEDTSYIREQNGRSKINVEQFLTVPPEVVCLICSGIMREPIKAVDGASYCRICYLSKPEFTSSARIPVFEQDEDLTNKIAALLCYCRYRGHGCDWKGKTVQLEQHLSECEKVPVCCINCESVYLKVEEMAHREKCDFEICICRKTFRKSEAAHHKNNCDYYIQCANCLVPIDYTKFAKHVKDCEKMFCKTCNEMIPQENMFSHAKQHIINAEMSGADHIKVMIGEIKSAQNSANMCKLTMMEYRQELNDLKSQVAELVKVGSGRKDGSLVWIITNVREKLKQAKKDNLAIYSPHFYSHENGYKMGAKLYLNGDGEANGSYISLYFLLYKGPFDDILNWPFSERVALHIMTFGRGEPKIEVFTPEKTSLSFEKPNGAQNIPSGYKRFAPQEILYSENYVKSGNLYIKIVTDTLKMKHP